MDDVDDISVVQQTKLLRVIEEKVFERVGGTKLIKANVRVVASTKINLLDKVGDGTFRQDLYYRLDVLRCRPPLRARIADIPALTTHLLRKIARDAPCTMDDQALAVLCRHIGPATCASYATRWNGRGSWDGGQITAVLLENDLRSTEAEESRATALDSSRPESVAEAGTSRRPWTPRKNVPVEAGTSNGNKTAAAGA